MSIVTSVGGDVAVFASIVAWEVGEKVGVEVPPDGVAVRVGDPVAATVTATVAVPESVPVGVGDCAGTEGIEVDVSVG